MKVYTDCVEQGLLWEATEQSRHAPNIPDITAYSDDKDGYIAFAKDLLESEQVAIKESLQQRQWERFGVDLSDVYHRLTASPYLTYYSSVYKDRSLTKTRDNILKTE